ncbi:hypothetical protein DSO57_1028796 [Entomophthora muscae]|uniref:Uncharacterized protein n=1 Tax=Entomophthora muscae TaxID=34485 RepID=A0ACC2UN23_9FUNG|nr:hypothetical protein DSO57_1028796 [Entomophthora muscae]
MAKSSNLLKSDSLPTVSKTIGPRTRAFVNRLNKSLLNSIPDSDITISPENLPGESPPKSDHGFKPNSYQKTSKLNLRSLAKKNSNHDLANTSEASIDEGSEKCVLLSSSRKQLGSNNNPSFDRNNTSDAFNNQKESSSLQGFEHLSISEPVIEPRFCKGNEDLTVSDLTPSKDCDIISEKDSIHSHQSYLNNNIIAMEIESVADKPASNSMTPICSSPGAKLSSKPNSESYGFHPQQRLALPKDEISQCSCILKALKHHPDSDPFLQPVDIVGLNIPDYPKVVKIPMDLSTVEEKLNAGAYEVVADFYTDIQRIFDNCYLFNKKSSPVSHMAKALQNLFEELKSIFSSLSHLIECGTAPPITRSAYSKQATSKPSRAHTHTSAPHSPIPVCSNSSMAQHHMDFCLETIEELLSRKHKAYSRPFLEPVDWEVMDLPDYPRIINHPMDLSTVKMKLISNKYKSATDFAHDVRLIFQNCFKYNSASNLVYQMGTRLQEVFEYKWSYFPSEEDSPDINAGLSHSKTSQSIISSLPVSEHTKLKKESCVLKRKDFVPSKDTISPSSKATKCSSGKYQAFTHAQKRELEKAIGRLSGTKLNKVVDLICYYMPELGSVSHIDL